MNEWVLLFVALMVVRLGLAWVTGWLIYQLLRPAIAWGVDRLGARLAARPPSPLDAEAAELLAWLEANALPTARDVSRPAPPRRP